MMTLCRRLNGQLQLKWIHDHGLLVAVGRPGRWPMMRRGNQEHIAKFFTLSGFVSLETTMDTQTSDPSP